MQTKPFKNGTIKIGTRGGPLALYQAHETRQRLMNAHDLTEKDFEIIVLSTKADRMTNQSLSEIGGKGLFTLELEERLLDGSLDFAVHCTKDMATKLPEGLEISAYLPREDPRDAFIGGTAKTIKDLPENALIGTSSMRRQALIQRMRPDLRVTLFRGLVGTRLQKLADGEVDATLLAYAGMKRLGIEDRATELLEKEAFPPAPGQGAICIESQTGDARVTELLAKINCEATQIEATCERAFLKALDGSCRTPIAGYTNLTDDQLTFYGLILSDNGQQIYDVTLSGALDKAEEIGTEAGNMLRAEAGDAFFKDWK